MADPITQGLPAYDAQKNSDREAILRQSLLFGRGVQNIGAAAADIGTLPVRAVMGAGNTLLRGVNAALPQGMNIPYIPEQAFGGSSASLTPYMDNLRKGDAALAPAPRGGASGDWESKPTVAPVVAPAPVETPKPQLDMPRLNAQANAPAPQPVQIAAPEVMGTSPISFATYGGGQGGNGTSGALLNYRDGTQTALDTRQPQSEELQHFNALNAQAAAYTPPVAAAAPLSTPLSAAPAGGADTGKVADFTATYGAAAARAGKALGVDPLVLLGQWGMETGWGKSVVPGTNNLGNIKDFSGGGVAATDNANGSNDKYRAFATADDFADHYVGLVGRKYQGAIGAGSDALKFGNALAAGGYAEDPKYADKVRAATWTAAGVPPGTAMSAPMQVASAPASTQAPVQSETGLVQMIKGMNSYYTRPDGSDVHLYPTMDGSMSEMSQAERNGLATHKLASDATIEAARIRAESDVNTTGQTVAGAVQNVNTQTAAQKAIEASRSADIRKNGTPIYNDVLLDPKFPSFGSRKEFAGMAHMGDDGEPKFTPVSGSTLRVEPKIGGRYNAPDGTYGKYTVKNKKIVGVN